MKIRMKGYRGRRVFPVVLALGFLLAGCGGGQGGTEPGSTEPGSTTENVSGQVKAEAVNLAAGVQQKKLQDTPFTASHSKALSTGAVKLLAKTVELAGDPNQNYLISPVSMQMAFGMLAAGSEDGSETQKELMELLLPGENATPDAVNAEMATLADRMRKAEGSEWNVVNSVWVKKDGDVKLQEQYISDAVNYYQAELYEAPFDESTVQEINRWVKENTRERIPEILQYLDEQSVVALVNALAFDGEWQKTIEPHAVRKNVDFTNADGTKSKVSMLQCGEHGYVQLAGGKGFLKPYVGGYSFLGLLPPEGMASGEYLQKLLTDKPALSDAVRGAGYEQLLQVNFPEFKAEYGADMAEIVQALGVKKSFGRDAEFGKMITPDSERISVDQVMHRAMIEVDRTGTKAAAATAIVATEAAAIEPQEIIEITLDRPFIYGIVDNRTGIPIFLGVQNTME